MTLSIRCMHVHRICRKCGETKMFDNVFGKSEYGWRKAVVCKL